MLTNKDSFKKVLFEVKGKQYNITCLNQIIHIDYQKEKNPKDEIIFNRVLSYNEDFGRPYLENVEVVGKVIKHARTKKIGIFKYKAKKRITKRQGSRTWFTRIEIISVEKK